MLVNNFNGQSSNTYSRNRLYVLADIHGHAEEFDNVLDQISDDIDKHPHAQIEIVIAGDMIDRGPQSKQVLDRVANFDSKKMRDAKLTLLLGNHEIALWQFMARPTDDLNVRERSWYLYHGGATTLASYGVFLDLPDSAGLEDSVMIGNKLQCFSREGIEKARLEMCKNFPASHRMLFKETNENASKNSKREYWYRPDKQERGFFICHGGVDQGLSLSNQPPCVLLGVDYKFDVSRDFSRYDGAALTDDNGDEWTVIHGHTIIGPTPIATESKGRISADTGCFHGGMLSAIVIADGEYQGALQCPSFYPCLDINMVPNRNNWPPQKIVSAEMHPVFLAINP